MRRVLLIIALTLMLLPVLPVSGQEGLSRRVAASDDPIMASVLLSQDAFATGTAEVVVLGRSDGFADNLSAAALTQASGPLLLVPPAPNTLPDEVEREITRVLGSPAEECDAGSPARVLILGGAAAVAPSIDAALDGDGQCTARVAGPTRVETSVAAARRLRDEDPSVSTLFIARSDNPADSTSASAWAARAHVPVVVTQSDELHPDVGHLLVEGGWDEVALLGGAAALSEDVRAQVDAATDGTVRRVSGATRDATAVAVAQDLWDRDERGDGVAIVNGFAQDFWTYALPGGVVSGREGAPLIYAQDRGLPESSEAYLSSEADYVITIGPSSAIATRVEEDAADLANADDRLYRLVYLDSEGTLHRYDGEADEVLTHPRATATDVNRHDQIAFTTAEGELWCLCGRGAARRLSDNSRGDHHSPVWTPDAGAVVTVVEAAGRGDIAITNLSTETTSLRTESGGYDPLEARDVFTADGEAMVAATEDSTIRLVALTGPINVQQLVGQGSHPVLSPDSDRLGYEHGDSTRVLDELSPSVAGRNVVALQGGQHWLGDDDMVIADVGTGELHTVPVDGDSVSTVIFEGALQGQLLSFDIDHNRGLVAVTSSGGGLKVISISRESQVGDGVIDATAAWFVR